jgi:metallo-beta-lactamase class B
VRVLKWVAGTALSVVAALGLAAWLSPPFLARAVQVVGFTNWPVEPVQIADNLYYVGARDIASFLITGRDGHVLIDGGMAGTPAQIVRNMRELGFDPHDVRIILNTHGHFDHAEGLAELKRLTGARLLTSPADKLLIEAGGRGDYFFGNKLGYQPAEVDGVLQDRQVVRLGSTVLTAHFTPGHTKGCTSWAFPVTIEGRRYDALLNCSVSLLGDPAELQRSYPAVVSDYAATYARLEALPCDVFLMPHALQFGLRAKRAALKAGNSRAFVDPEGCRAFLADSKGDFLERSGTAGTTTQ